MFKGFFSARNVFAAAVVACALATTFVGQQRGAEPVLSPKKTTTDKKLYAGSYALLIGNTAYSTWNSLPGVARDIPLIEAVLRDKHGFTVEKALNLTRSELRDRVDEFISKYGQDPDNRLLIYYAGHGYTLKLPDGRTMGYLVMKDAPAMPAVESSMKETPANVADFRLRAVSMDEVSGWARAITARHALFVFDSCFSGTVLYRDSVAAPSTAISEETMKPMRAFLTAGDERQTVRDESPFRKAFVSGLEGAADINGDGLIFVTELADHVKREVLAETRNSENPQSPIFDKQEGFRRGDMVFLSPKGDPHSPGAGSGARFASNPVWNTPPLISGDWETLDAAASVPILAKLSTAVPADAKERKLLIDRIVKFRRTKLSFYPNSYLYEGLVLGPASFETGNLSFIISNDTSVTILNGTGVPIHNLTDTIHLDLDSDQKAEDYLRFFMAAINGGEGEFHVIESGGELPWDDDVPASSRAVVEKWIGPLLLEEKADRGTWKYHMTLQYSDSIFNAVVQLKADGSVEMLDDEPISIELPLKSYHSQPRHLESKWAQPLVEGDGVNWRRLGGEEDDAMRKRLLDRYAASDYADAIGRIESFRTAELPFYPGVGFCEGLMPATRFSAPSQFVFATLPDGTILPIDGKAATLALLNSKCPPHIDSENAALYAAFVGAVVDEAGSQFRMIQPNDKSMQWLENVPVNTIKKLTGMSVPMSVEPQGNKGWAVSCTVVTPSGVRRVRFVISKTGELKRTEESNLSDQAVPILWTHFNGPLRSATDRQQNIKITVNSADSAFLSYLGRQNAKDLNYELAMVRYTKAIQLDPSNHFAYQLRAEAQLVLGKTDAALADITKALQLNDGYADSYLTKARILKKLGDRAGAETAARKAVESDPKNDGVKKAAASIIEAQLP